MHAFRSSWLHHLRQRWGDRQLLAIAAVLALGLAGAAALLLPGGPSHDHEAAPNAAPRADDLVRMSDEQIAAAGITLDTAAPAPVRGLLRLPGEIRFDEDRTAHVVPRVAGVVEQVAVTLGQSVRAGQVLAVISSAAVSDQRSELQAAQRRLALAHTTYEREKQLFEEKISPEQDVLQAEQAWREAEIAVANARQKLQAVGAGAAPRGALNRYELRAPFDGTVIEKHLALGEQVREDTNVFTVSDLRNVWAQVGVPAQALAQVRVGRPVVVRATAFEQQAPGQVGYVGPLIGEQTRTAQARVVLANPELAWRPGLFVEVEVPTGEAMAAVTVAAEAVQTHEGARVVFLRTPGGFVPRPVTVGRGEGGRVEIVQGLPAGSRYAAGNAFVVKAEAGKAAASHEH
jgi:cobalt-zinc-cadmium efflux system membrane fusion protein